MATVDKRMKTLHMSNKGSYIDTRERFRIFGESKRREGEINDHHEIGFNKMLGVITLSTTTS